MAPALSRARYRLLLRSYPREFRERFAADLESDFRQMVEADGVLRAWRRVLSDLPRALPLVNRTAMAERARTARVAGPGLPPGDPLILSLLFDLRHGARALAKAPAFTVVTVLTLAFEIGANSAIFSLVNAVLLRPLGYEAPERLMLLHQAIPESGVARFEVSPPDYLDLVAYQQSFSDIGAYRTRVLEFSGGPDPEQVNGAEVTASVFPVQGIAPRRAVYSSTKRTSGSRTWR